MSPLLVFLDRARRAVPTGSRDEPAAGDAGAGGAAMAESWTPSRGAARLSTPGSQIADSSTTSSPLRDGVAGPLDWGRGRQLGGDHCADQARFMIHPAG